MFLKQNIWFWFFLNEDNIKLQLEFKNNDTVVEIRFILLFNDYLLVVVFFK